MTGLPIRVDWNGNQREATTGEIARAEGTAARIRREVGEMRTAAEQLANGGPVDQAVADFLTVQATLLERSGGTLQRADNLRPEDDTRDQPGMLNNAARSALLIARAHLGAK
ncbi:hypothetical protein [Streptomyces sp. NPDC059076]|uniref:hypothetical protein n=1 Tax=unclassified Streptomyces TaxID=2593676 RepID=UPI00369F52E2